VHEVNFLFTTLQLLPGRSRNQNFTWRSTIRSFKYDLRELRTSDKDYLSRFHQVVL
jgi:hypothetical protein